MTHKILQIDFGLGYTNAQGERITSSDRSQRVYDALTAAGFQVEAATDSNASGNIDSYQGIVTHCGDLSLYKNHSIAREFIEYLRKWQPDTPFPIPAVMYTGGYEISKNEEIPAHKIHTYGTNFKSGEIRSYCAGPLKALVYFAGMGEQLESMVEHFNRYCKKEA